DGQTDMGLVADQFANTNNNFRTVTFVVTDGFQKITPVTEEVVVTITGNAEEATYDGKEHTVTGYEVEINNDLYTEDDFKFNGNDTASRTYVAEGEDESGVTMMGMTPEDFENLSTNFTNITFVVNDGSMTIDKRPITLTSKGATKPYDGTPLEKKVVDISGEGLAECDDITYLPDAWGSQTLVGKSDNTFDYEFIRVTKKGVVANVLSALGILDEAGAAEIVGHEVNDIEKNYDVTVEFGTLEVTDKGADPDDVLTKTHEDKSYKVGETITFTIEVTNIYDEAKTITLEEMEGVTLKQSVFKDVEPGAVVSTTATYTVTEEDALAGTFTNTVKATYSGEDEPFDNDDTVDKFAHMTVTKTVTNKPADGEVFRTGETIKYEITVTNDGTQTMTDIVVKDELTGDEWKIDKLAAGKSKTFKAEYIVTEADGVSGSVTNVATAQGNDPDGDDTPGVEGKVTTKTDKSNEPTVPKTGDNTPLVEFSVIFGASLITLLMMLFRRKNERA
ncbi:MAG: DUF11 domain-containing protein, partial [Clostridia bacterium]|nr:DUF11 domain-containing protein [Clostridia bacterium]